MTVQIYLNFDGEAEEAFNFYKSVFGGELSANMKMVEAPDMGKLSEEEKNRTMHISLPLSDGIVLMGSDILPSFGQTLNKGNNMYASLHPDSREEADRLFNGLSAGGTIEMPMADQFWGDYFGSFTDKYGIGWMVNYNPDQEWLKAK